MKGVYVFFQAEDGIRGVERFRGLGDLYKGQVLISIYYENPLRLSKEVDLSFLEFSNQDGIRVSQNRHQYETCAPKPINARTARPTL